MSSKFDIRLLQPEDFSQMYRTFVDAFSSYPVKMDLTKEMFRDRIEVKVNISYKHSVGVFHGEKLIGFLFNSISEYEGIQTAYNGGTGVLKEYWGMGLTKKMYGFIAPILKNEDVYRCILEVITTNNSAIKAYQKSGFVKKKSFHCFKLKKLINTKAKVSNLKIKESNAVSLNDYEHIGSHHPSMMDSTNMLIHNLKNETCIEAKIDKELVGFLIFQYKTGRISQFGIKKEFRRKGIGRSLLVRAHDLSQNKRITVLNVMESDKGTIDFLNSIGFVNEIDQYEMEMVL
jgi:ribosomal protein S18 acetylase RimI-like enzyme